MAQSAEAKLKAIIKRRDARIIELKKITREDAEREYDLQRRYAILQQQQQDFKNTLIEFLGLDQHIRDVVRDSL